MYTPYLMHFWSLPWILGQVRVTWSFSLSLLIYLKACRRSKYPYLPTNNYPTFETLLTLPAIGMYQKQDKILIEGVSRGKENISESDSMNNSQRLMWIYQIHLFLIQCRGGKMEVIMAIFLKMWCKWRVAKK